MNSNSLTIIIADDDADDRALLLEALIENGISNEKVVLVSDGDELISVLPLHSKLPCIVFLDLNMPKKNGLKVLSEVKADPNLKHIPILIFTTSNSRNDILTSYKLGGNTYFTKPFSYAELSGLVKAIKLYWFEKAILLLPV